jgi:hypothetical protein
MATPHELRPAYAFIEQNRKKIETALTRAFSDRDIEALGQLFKQMRAFGKSNVVDFMTAREGHYSLVKRQEMQKTSIQTIGKNAKIFDFGRAKLLKSEHLERDLPGTQALRRQNEESALCVDSRLYCPTGKGVIRLKEKEEQRTIEVENTSNGGQESSKTNKGATGVDRGGYSSPSSNYDCGGSFLFDILPIPVKHKDEVELDLAQRVTQKTIDWTKTRLQGIRAVLKEVASQTHKK